MHVCIYAIWGTGGVWRSEDTLKMELVLSFLVCRSWGLNSGYQAWQQVPLTTHPSCWPIKEHALNRQSILVHSEHFRRSFNIEYSLIIPNGRI